MILIPRISCLFVSWVIYAKLQSLAEVTPEHYFCLTLDNRLYILLIYILG